MNDRHLSYLFRSPQIVEAAVRAALADALFARRLRLGEIDARTFGNRALASIRESLETQAQPLDELGGHELEVATVRAAARFFSTKLARRLFTIGIERFEATPPGADAALRDAGGRTHVVRLEACANDGERVHLARRLAQSGRPARALQAPRVYLCSLRDGKLRSFTFSERLQSGAA